MPKIKITEQDLTGLQSGTSTSNTVYIPCMANDTTGFGPTLCEYMSEITGLKDKVNSKSIAFKLAQRLVRLGMQVLIEGIPGTADTNTKDTITPATAVPETSWTAIMDKTLYDIRFLSMGDFVGTAVDANMIACAEARQDCIALVDHKQTITPESGSTYADAVRDYIETTDASTKTSVVLNSDFAAMFTPWIKVQDSVDFTEETAVPASFGYLLAYSRAARNGNEGLAIANYDLGSIPELTSVEHVYTQSEIEVLQARSATQEVGLDDSDDNKGVAINPIAYVRPYNYVIWGNRTMHSNDGTIVAKSLLNIRNTACTIKKKLYDAARKYTFEQNSNILWINFQAELAPTLTAMKTGNLLLGYKWDKLDTDSKTRLKARLTVVPVYAVEDFDLTLTLSDSLDVEE